MNIALFAIAAAMIVGGLLATFLGWDIVLVERGWTMVIAGSVFAASGALLLGIAAAVSRLTQIHAELNRLHASLSEEEPLPRQPAPDLSSAALAGGLLGGAAGAGVAGVGAATLAEPEQPPLPLFPEAGAPEQERKEPETLRREEPAPEPVMPPEPRIYPEPVREAEQAREEEEAPEVRLPDFLIAGRYRETREEIEESEIDEGLYAPGPVDEKVDLAATPAETGPVAGAEEEPRAEELREPEEETLHEPVAEPSEEREREPEPEAAPEPERAEEPTTARAVIGTYNSGDNHYVMYSDGSIEAETPQGLFHFNSLDELKEFIASGGESNQGSSAT